MFKLLRVERCMRKTRLLRFLIICSLLRFSCGLLQDLHWLHNHKQKHIKHLKEVFLACRRWSGLLDSWQKGILAFLNCELSKDVHYCSNLAPKRKIKKKYVAKILPGNCGPPDPSEGDQIPPKTFHNSVLHHFFILQILLQTSILVNQHAGCKSSYKTLLQEGIGHVNWRT